MDELLLTTLQIQSIYIDVLDLMSDKKYFVADQKLQTALNLYAQLDFNNLPSQDTLAIYNIQQLHDKIRVLHTDIDNYLNASTIISNVQLTEQEKEEINKECQIDIQSNHQLHTQSNTQSNLQLHTQSNVHTRNTECYYTSHVDEFELDVDHIDYDNEPSAWNMGNINYQRLWQNIWLSMSSCWLPIQHKITSQYYSKVKKE